MDSDNVKIVKDLVKKNLGIVNRLAMEKKQNLECIVLTTQHLAAAVEGVASLLMEHVMVPKELEEPETQPFTVVGFYPESNEVVVEHYEALNLQGAVNMFWADDCGGAGEQRRDRCNLISVFHGRLYDLLSTNLCLDEGLVSFPQWQEAMEEASAKETPK